MLRPCLGVAGQPCGKLSPRSRCQDCRRHHERARPPRPTTLVRTAAEQQRREATVDEHIATYGYTCPGWQRPPHPVLPPNILTADHITPVDRSGRGDGPLQVLCRVCNGSKSNRTT
jgi:5-methylcytosine-specific restriction enzyme A